MVRLLPGGGSLAFSEQLADCALDRVANDLRDLTVVVILVRARKKTKLTQTQIARRIGRSQPWLSKVETGDLQLNVIEFAQLCRELKLQPGRVLGGRLPLSSH